MNAIKGPKRGVSIYSYGELYKTMTLEDCMMDMYDMGATGIEILANGHIEGYPELSDEWLEYWEGLCTKYNIVPAEYGHWIESRMYGHKEDDMEEIFAILERDLKIAGKLKFPVLRTKLGVIDDTLSPVPYWREIIKRALPIAEENHVVMCPEIHIPTRLKSKMVDDYVEFIEQTGTKNFGLNIDFGTFQNVFDPNGFQMPGMPEDGSPCSYPQDLVPLLPYIYCCHAKFNNMDEDCNETTIPYQEILTVLKDNGWDGYMVSEYEGKRKDEPGFVSEQLRRQHIMMKRILGY